MEWTATKREAEPDSALLRGAKPRGPSRARGARGTRPPETNNAGAKVGEKVRTQRTRTPNITYLVKALARLALQQETAIKILRQDYSWVLFVQPGNQGPLPLLFAADQKWKEVQEEGATATLFGCLLQMLHTGLKDVERETPTPFQTKAEEMKWLKDGHWCYQKWSPALGSLVVGNMTGITAFQLDISNRTKGHQTVWECMEALSGLSALQIIGLQLRRDTRASATSAGRILLVRLLNSSNTCYIKASVRAVRG